MGNSSNGGDTVTERAVVVIGEDGRHFRMAEAVRPNQYNEKPPLLAAYYTTGAVALVTGGTSGIGKAAALALAKAGAKVVVAGRRENEGAAVVEAIEHAGGKALFVRTDVGREADVKALVDKTVGDLRTVGHRVQQRRD